MRGGGRLRAGAAGPSVWFFTRASGGRALARWCPDRAEVWEVALGVLPGSSGVLPGSPWLLPDRSRTFPVSSRQLPAPVLHTIIPIHTRHPAPARRERGAGRVERVARRIRVGRSPSAFGERMARLRERVPLRQGTYRWPGGVGVGPPRQVQRL